MDALVKAAVEVIGSVHSDIVQCLFFPQRGGLVDGDW